ncbi:MAG: c-type cytochrome domain-containing protein [Acidobacteriota bacterium]|nr:c-type cytochrome domain-containing protein [Acidobacteriota bacterium]
MKISGETPVLRAALLGLLAFWVPAAVTAAVSYHEEVWPIIQTRCQGCHQPALLEGGLDLTNHPAALEGGKGGPSYVPGEPDESVLFRHISGDLEPLMPNQGEPLTADQIDLFRRWITEGAIDDTPEELKGPRLSDGPPTYVQPPVITAVAFSPDDHWLAVSGYREVLLHRADGSGLEARLLGLSDRIQSLLFLPGGRSLVATGGTPGRFGEVQVWDVAERKLQMAKSFCYDTLFGASLSPDSRKIAVGCADHSVRVVWLNGLEQRKRLNHHENWVLGTAFGGDSQRIVSVGRDRAAKLSETDTGAFIENVNLLRGELAAVVRHPNRDAVVIGGEDRVPYFYKMDRPRKMLIADDSTLIREFERQRGEIFALAISPDGRRLAVAGASEEVPIYDIESGERIATATGHVAGIYTLSFSGDSARLATAGFDGRVRIYSSDDAAMLTDFVPVPISEPESTRTADLQAEQPR